MLPGNKKNLNNFTEAHYLYCILLLTGIKEVSWKSAKGMMSEANFLKSLTEMDVDAITAKQTATVKGNSPIYLYSSSAYFPWLSINFQYQNTKV